MDQKDTARAKMLGVLIRDARLYARRGIEECAAAVNMTPEAFTAIEEAKQEISLPALENLALYLGVPLAHFWGTQTISEQRAVNFAALSSLRQRMIGAQLRQTREEKGLSAAELAAEAGLDEATLTTYELGQTPISIFHLEKLGHVLNVTLEHFIDTDRGPLARHEHVQRQSRRFGELPADLQSFVTEPVNVAYLETARRLSGMDAQRLRSIAEALLDITY
jgi:transcriptional regulator with XRE-family HTH domain